MVKQLQQPNTANFEQVYELIKYYSEKREMLPLTMDEIYHRAQAFKVLVDEDDLIGCAHLDIFTDELAEVKSLAVSPEYLGKGYGKQLVAECEAEAKKLGIKRLFALTYREKFFESLGFKQVSMDTLPEKVYKECVKCHYYNNCNEVAVVKDL